MNYDERVQWVFQTILEGLCKGRALRQIAGDIVNGLHRIAESQIKVRKP